MARTLAARLARRATRSWSPGSTTTPTSGPGCTPRERAGATVRWADFDPATGELAAGGVARRALAAHPAGRGHRRVQPDRHPAGRARRSPTSPTRSARCCYVDGVHLTAHAAVDVEALGADFYACSPYKFLGPHCGVLAAAPALLETLHPHKLLPVDRRRPRALRAGHAALRAARRHDRGRRLPRRPGAPAPATAGDRVLRAHGRGRGARGPAARPHRGRPRGAARGHACYARAAHRTPTLLLTFDGRALPRSLRVAGRARRQRARPASFYALEASRQARPGRRRRAADRAGALLRRRRRRPAAGRPGGHSWRLNSRLTATADYLDFRWLWP